MDLTHIHRTEPEEAAWAVTLPNGEGDPQVFADYESGGVLPALLDALGWRAEQTGGRKDWGWVEEGLERVDRGGTHGWWASVNLGSYLDADLFEDDEHGGVREALLAALAWRRRVARPGGGSGGGGGGGGGGRSSGGGGRGGKDKQRPAAARSGGSSSSSNGRRSGRKRPRRGNPRPPQ